ncbi:hypothetical protein MYX84_13355 [Acidobacteria bacterium AH-259-O06]|nr:hypothetical protein [Acidobacteria bacterium AH-259-O06]
MAETVLAFLAAAAILVLSAFITHLFARYMYNRCPECRTLNARRRTHCRNCGHVVRSERH